MRGADLIAQKLKAAGCEAAFGIPGGEVIALVDALGAAGITFRLARHENAAGFMAEGYWHATGTPGILVATIGPGVANAVNVIANAGQDRVPLIVLTGCLEGHDADTYTHQVFDHQAVLAPLVKATFRANPGSLDAVLDKAITIALSGQPGPVHIDVPIPVAESLTDERAGPPPPRRPRDTPASPRLVGAARDALAGAERPIAIAGLDALEEDAGAAITAFCRHFGVPLITTYKAKGLLAEDDPLALGGAGLSPAADRALLPLVRAADLVLLLGYDPIEMRIGWRDPWPIDANVVEVTPVLRTHGMHRVTTTLVGSLAPTLAALGEDIAPCATWPDGAPAEARNSLDRQFAPEPGGWGPAHAFHVLREALPADTVITIDSGAHRILLSQLWRTTFPRSVLQSTALCTMGSAVPLAAGYRLGRSDRPVVAFVGDAGLEMVLGELATLREFALPVIVVVLVDESLALIEMKQRAAQLANRGVDFTGSDFPAIARALGGEGVWVDDAATLRRETAAALAREDQFSVLAVRIGRRAYDGKF